MTSKVAANCSSFEMDSLRLCLFAVELTANTGILFLSVLLAILLSRTNTLDRNPKVLLANHQFASFSIAWTRFILIPQMLVPNGLLSPGVIAPFQWFHDVSINVNTFIQLAITLECLFSTFCPSKWESFTAQLWVPVFTFLWPWLFTGLLYFIEQIQLLDTIPQFIGLFLLNILCSLIFCHLYLVNRRKYRLVNAGDLAGKYKIIVNIKTVRTLNFVSALSALRNFITMSLLLLIILYFKPLCNYYAYLISSHSYDLSVSFYNLLLIVPLVLTHDEFAKHFRQFLSIRLRRASEQPKCAVGTSGQNGGTTVAKNVLGENIVVSHNPSEYFNQLAKSWDAVPRPSLPRSIAPVWPSSSRRGSKRIVDVEIPRSGSE